jgi:hypothetical protein
MCFNKTYSKVCIGKHLSDNFHIQNGVKLRIFFIATAFQLYFRIPLWVSPGIPGGTEIKGDTSAAGLC